MSTEHVDVLIIGAGLSGINTAHRLQTLSPGRSYALLDERTAIGGTWDLFKYPGIRSDVSLVAFGFAFNPWKDPKAISSGPSITRYMRDTVEKFGIDQHIRLKHHVVSADFSTETSLWTVELEVGSARTPQTITCSFLSLCTGYYDRNRGYLPDLPGADDFDGDLIHPQHWPEDYDYSGKRVAIIGSGATAATLVPAMATTAKHVTMVQRSPTYYNVQPDIDPMITRAFRWLPEPVAAGALRWRGILRRGVMLRFGAMFPDAMRKQLQKGVADKLADPSLVEKHFTPSYAPWDQRVCFVPNGDLFEAINEGRASVVTDTIDTITPTGIQMSSGEFVEADVIITATGLNLQAFGGIPLSVDGSAVDPGSTVLYRGSLISGVPNLSACFGYTRAPWTLGSDIAARYLCRVLNYMDKNGYTMAIPRFDRPESEIRPLMELNSGYVKRSPSALPNQGASGPWVRHPYVRGFLVGRFARIDEEMEFCTTADQRQVALSTSAAPR